LTDVSRAACAATLSYTCEGAAWAGTGQACLDASGTCTNPPAATTRAACDGVDNPETQDVDEAGVFTSTAAYATITPVFTPTAAFVPEWAGCGQAGNDGRGACLTIKAGAPVAPQAPLYECSGTLAEGNFRLPQYSGGGVGDHLFLGIGPYKDKSHCLETAPAGGETHWCERYTATRNVQCIKDETNDVQPTAEKCTPMPLDLVRIHEGSSLHYVTEASGATVGCASADWNGDAVPDTFVSNHGRNEMFLSDGAGGIDPAPPMTIDPTCDGAPCDPAATCTKQSCEESKGTCDNPLGATSKALCNGVFTSTAAFIDVLGSDEISNGATAGDFDGDGRLDLIVAYWEKPNRLYLNQFGGTCTNPPCTNTCSSTWNGATGSFCSDPSCVKAACTGAGSKWTPTGRFEEITLGPVATTVPNSKSNGITAAVRARPRATCCRPRRPKKASTGCRAASWRPGPSRATL
jgi:hypothetical protein